MTDRTTHSAGAGSPVPAESSPPPDAGQPPIDVVAPEARLELDRIRRRWAELLLDHAESRMPLLRRLLDDLAPRSVDPSTGHPPPVPDLGPATVVDQLTVLVWDAYAAGRGDGILELLTELRRSVA